MAKTFKDQNGNEWLIPINVAAVKRVKERIDIDLLGAVTGELIPMLLGNFITLVDVIYVLLEPELSKAGISDEQFGASMGGESIDDATKAFLEALTDFFPLCQRAALTDVLAKVQMLEARVTEKRREILDGTKIDQILEAELTAGDLRLDRRLSESQQPSGLGRSSGSSPASAGSTRAA